MQNLSHDFQNEDFLALIEDASDQSILVASNVEHNAIADNVGTSKNCTYVAPVLPGYLTVVYVGVPRLEWSFGVSAVGTFPELPQP